MQEPTVRVAVMQAAPVLFDKEKTIEKVVEKIGEAAKAGAQLIVFPEAYIPGYPRGFTYGFVVGSRTMEGREDWKVYYDNSVVVPSADTDRIAEAAREAGAYVVIGVSERDAKNATLYCSMLYFAPDGSLVGKHRKLKPTGSERLLWGDGHEGGIVTVDTPFATLGGLICWENYMPLARAALYERGVTIYIAPTADNRQEWQSTMQHIALEGRCFVIGCNQYANRSMLPGGFHEQEKLESMPDEFCPGGSVIIDPFGERLAGPVYGKEEMLLADLDLRRVPLSRLDFDPTGHYARPDVLELVVHERASHCE